MKSKLLILFCFMSLMLVSMNIESSDEGYFTCSSKKKNVALFIACSGSAGGILYSVLVGSQVGLYISGSIGVLSWTVALYRCQNECISLSGDQENQFTFY